MLLKVLFVGPGFVYLELEGVSKRIFVAWKWYPGLAWLVRTWMLLYGQPGVQNVYSMRVYIVPWLE